MSYGLCTMGLHSAACRLLLALSNSGIRFGRAATLGRQRLHISAPHLLRVFKEAGTPRSAAVVNDLLAEPFAEPFLLSLGATSVDSIDFSNYEGASQIWDLNQQIPTTMGNQFSLLIDGGSLEHVFNVPVAIKNCIEMLKVGGHLIHITPANNFMGHGFYQFSPELFFRVYCEENGCIVSHMILVEAEPDGKTDIDSPWYEVRDPKILGTRVELLNARPAYLMVVVRKLNDTRPLAQPPSQSDYVSMWQGKRSAPDSRAANFRRSLMSDIQQLIPRTILRAYWRRRPILRRLQPPAYHLMEGWSIGKTHP